MKQKTKQSIATTMLGASLAFSLMFASCQKDGLINQNPVMGSQEVIPSVSYKAQPIETLCKEYFTSGKNEDHVSTKIIAVTNEFMLLNKGTKEFSKKNPCHIQPVYAYGIDGVAYYEVWFTEDNSTVKGWILISATDKDYPLVNFSQGTPYSLHLVKGDNSQSDKVYRFGVSFYALERNGAKVTDYGKMPSYVLNSDVSKSFGGQGSTDNDQELKNSTPIDLQEGVDYFKVSSYESLKQLFPKSYFTTQRADMARDMQARLFPLQGHGEGLKRANYDYRWVEGQQCYYTQIPAHSGWNTTDCWSGCNNNAWTNIYGWWDRNAGKGNLIPTTSTGEASPIYRNTTARKNSIDPAQMYIRSISYTYCGDGTGWTKWSDTWRGYQYAPHKGYGYSYQYRWCNNSGCNVELADILTDGVANNRRPVYIGANSHAYVGYGWAQWTTNTDWTWAYCYPGWSENNNDDVWIWWHDFNATVKIFVY